MSGASTLNTLPEANRASRHSALVRFLRGCGVVAGVVILFFLALGLWNLVVVRWQNAHVAIPGQFYSIDGYQMRIFCSGEGLPAVVIETGLGSTSTGWLLVQEKLSTVTRTCTYDRAGLGWSDPRPGAHDAEAIAGRLHALLDAAGVQRPFVAVGHSAGGLYWREYAQLYSSDIAGVAFVDSATPQQMDELPGFRADYESDRSHARRDLWFERMRVWSGWERLTGGCRATPDKGFEKYADLYNAKECRPGYVGGDLGDFMALQVTIDEAARLTSFGNKPVLVLSKDTHRAGMNERQLAEAAIWDREQESLKSLSSSSWRVIARGSGHSIFKDRRELVISQIELLVNYLRGGAVPPFESTSTQ